MARCTAPVQGHRTASGRAACPVCGGSYRSYSGYGGYGGYGSSSYPSYSPPRSSGVGGSGGSSRPRWSRTGSSVVYTPAEVRTLEPVRQSIENRASLPDRRDVFLCHAWDDRRGAAKDLHDHLESLGVSVWFSEKDVILGTTLLREIDWATRIREFCYRTKRFGGSAVAGAVFLCKTPRLTSVVIGKRGKGRLCRDSAAELQLPIVALFFLILRIRNWISYAFAP